ncbi:MAG: site-specific integrase [Gammaproteobacteria bacterium]|nr:site-specific integrase [Gammaproteobacteria bacterium]MDH5693780.1 site-specific integrase [Gammaproteobacteria bacterium]
MPLKPTPLFDNLEQQGNPFKVSRFELPAWIPNTPLGALQDYEYAWKYLWSYNGSTATFNAYRREVERVIQWSWFVAQRTVASLKREDIEEYVRFCMSPPKEWVGLKQESRFLTKNGTRVVNERWRPFVVSISKEKFRLGHEVGYKDYSPSQASIQSTFSILSSFFGYLIQEELIESNPVALIRQKSKFVKKNQQQAPVRRISNLQWEYVIETIEQAANENPVEYERSLFIMNCLFAMYLRISELVADERSEPKMGDFRRDNDGNWWFHVTGKGNKDRIVTVSDEMLKSLKRYRKHLGLSSLPSLDDKTPLVSKISGKGPLTSTRQIRILVQSCFDRAYERMRRDGLEEDAGELKSATVHWLRHTGISEDVKIRPREHVRDDAGHASMQTTDRYIESDLRERHASGKKKKLKDLA